jgi:Arc/MetJ-type ribon-helix-helix transcriptional regulator
MTKKDYSEIVRSSGRLQESNLEDRYRKADSVALIPAAADSPQPSPDSTASEAKSYVKHGTYSMPQEDYQLIEDILTKLLQTGRQTTKSEIIRAAVYRLSDFDIEQLVEAVNRLKKVRPGK